MTKRNDHGGGEMDDVSSETVPSAGISPSNRPGRKNHFKEVRRYVADLLTDMRVHCTIKL
jgi:hypothetical protein